MTSPRQTLVPEARRLIEKGRHDQALEQYLAYAQANPSDARIWQHVGDLQLKLGATAGALDAYRRAAEAYAEAGHFAKAASLYKQILAHEPDHVEMRVRLADLCEQLSQLADARRELEHAAELSRASGRVGDALDLARKIAALTPDDVKLRLVVAERCARAGYIHQAMSDFSSIAQWLHHNHRRHEFLAVAERALQLVPVDHELARMVAREYLEQGEAETAAARLRPCFEAAPEQLETLELLAEAFEQLGRRDRALLVLRAMAWHLHCKGEIGRRNEVYRRILGHVPNDRDALAALKIRNRKAPLILDPPALSPTR